MAFHAHSGWFFERRDDGSVRVTKRVGVLNHREEAMPLFGVIDSVEFDRSTWASIVASVSAAGESAETFEEALNLHGV